ncbi:hypothetical protein [Trebonia kvetii]|nr:hypothetical protein [Trebonia kvetii]
MSLLTSGQTVVKVSTACSVPRAETHMDDVLANREAHDASALPPG